MKCIYPLCKIPLSKKDIINNYRCPFCNECLFCSKKCCLKYCTEFHNSLCQTRLEMNFIQKKFSSKMVEDIFQGKVLNESQLTEYLKGVNFNPSNLINPNNSEIEEIIGIGASSDVALKIDKITSRKYAIKTINKSKILNALNPNEVEQKIRHEIMLHLSIKHPNNINLLTFYETNDKISLVMEHAEGGSLYDYIKMQTKRLNYDRAIFFFIQICNAIMYLHKNKIVHRDIKPENILLSNNILKLCDFGISTYCGIEKR